MMSEVEKRHVPEKKERPVRDHVPVRRTPPAAGCFGKFCPVETPKRDGSAGAISADEFSRRYARSGATGRIPLSDNRHRAA